MRRPKREEQQGEGGARQRAGGGALARRRSRDAPPSCVAQPVERARPSPLPERARRAHHTLPP
eukprot:scaffold74986_cov26-Tisochrysis_lutea.AAC.1